MSWIDVDALPVPDLGLACMGCGYPLAGLMSHACPECGAGFSLEAYIPTGDMPTLVADGALVRAERDIIELLQAYRITYVEQHGPLALLSHPGMVPNESAALGVMRDQYFEAVDLIRRWRHDEPLPPAVELLERDPWRCAQCREENPGNFEVCWSCGHEHDPATG